MPEELPRAESPDARRAQSSDARRPKSSDSLRAKSPDALRAMHDLGGAQKFMCEPVDIEPHALTDFDKEVDALRQILGMKKIMGVDELRRCIEAIPEADYLRLSYYRKWIRSITDNLLQKGVITEAELRAALEPAGLEPAGLEKR